MLKGSLEILIGFLGHKLCVLDLFFLGLSADMYWVREVFCVLITHYKDSISEWGQAFPYIFNIEIAFSTCGCLVSRRCPSQWMSYGAGHEKSFNRTTLSCQTNLFVTEFLQNEKKALASWECGGENQVYLQQNESCYQWTLLWCRQLMRVARCVFSCQPFPEPAMGDTSNQVSIPILRSNLIYLQIDSLKLTAKTSENWCFGGRKLYNLDCWWTASFYAQFISGMII